MLVLAAIKRRLDHRDRRQRAVLEVAHVLRDWNDVGRVLARIRLEEIQDGVARYAAVINLPAHFRIVEQAEDRGDIY